MASYAVERRFAARQTATQNLQSTADTDPLRAAAPSRCVVRCRCPAGSGAAGEVGPARDQRSPARSTSARTSSRASCRWHRRRTRSGPMARPALVDGQVVHAHQQRAPAPIEVVTDGVDQTFSRGRIAERRAVPSPVLVARQKAARGREHVERQPAVRAAARGARRAGTSADRGRSPGVARCGTQPPRSRTARETQNAADQRGPAAPARAAARDRRAILLAAQRQHRRRVIEPDDGVPVAQQRHHEPPGAAREIQHRPAALVGERAIEAARRRGGGGSRDRRAPRPRSARSLRRLHPLA